MKPNLVTAEADESVAVVCRRMKQHHLGAVLVMQAGKMTAFLPSGMLNHCGRRA